MQNISRIIFKTTLCLALLTNFGSFVYAQESPVQQDSLPADPEASSLDRGAETFLNLRMGSNKIQGGLSLDSEARLMDPVVADFNGDGVDDIIWGAPGMSSEGFRSSGAVFVQLGSPELSLKGQRDTTFKEAYDYRFDGMQNDGQLGLVIASGDMNGDGIADIIASEPGNKGAIYVLYGGKELPKGHYPITDERIADLAFYGADHGSLMGMTLCIADMNSDGMEDLIFSSIGFNTRGQINSSDVTLIPFRRSWNKKSFSVNDKLQGKVKLVRSVAMDVRAIHSCAVGDFNDDGTLDLALGMPVDSTGQQRKVGSVSLIFSPSKYSGGIVNLGEKKPSWGVKIFGDQEDAMFGQSLVSADFNADSYDDLVISSPRRLVKGPESEGALYFYSGAQLKSSNYKESYRIVGTGGLFGTNIQAIDINSDKRPDLVVSQPQVEKTFAGVKTGLVSVFLGGPHFSDSEAQIPTPDIQLAGREFMQLGLASGSGDFNADGKQDWVLRAAADPYQRERTGSLIVISNTDEIGSKKALDGDFLTLVAPSRGGRLITNGEIVQLQDKRYRTWLSPGALGKRSVICLVEDKHAVQNRELSTSGACDITLIGPETAKIESYSFADFNGDGKLDLALGMPDFNLPKANGAVVVITLPENLGATLTIDLDSKHVQNSAWVFGLENEDYSALGNKVVFKDIDKDNLPELLIGAPKRRLDDALSGSIFVVNGKKDRKHRFYPLSEVLSFEGIDAEEFGSDWEILDFNLDGVLDLVGLANKTATINGDIFATLYVIFSPLHLSPTGFSVQSSDLKSMRIQAPKSRSGLKLVHQNVDLSGDGKADLILISPNHRTGLQKEGSLHVIYSSEDRKGGTIDLSKETLSNFMLYPERNERIVDARFVEIRGRKELLLSTATTLGTISYNVYEILPLSEEKWVGQLTTLSFKRQEIAGAKTKSPQELLIFDRRDLQSSEDEVWLLQPYVGSTTAGQGEAVLVE